MRATRTHLYALDEFCIILYAFVKQKKIYRIKIHHVSNENCFEMIIEFVFSSLILHLFILFQALEIFSSHFHFDMCVYSIEWHEYNRL